MEKQVLNELEVASKSVVMHSARQFTQALAESPQFIAFEESYQAFRNDQPAQLAYQALQKKQESLRMMLMLNAVDDNERQELKELEEQFYRLETVQGYMKAQENLVSVCQEIGDILSDAIGLDFGVSCRIGGCCG